MKINQVNGGLGQNGVGFDCNAAQREFIRLIELFHIFIRVVVTDLLHLALGRIYPFVKIHDLTHLRWLHFIVYNL